MITGAWSKEVRIELGPIDGLEGTRWEVSQECNGLTEEYKSCNCIHECDNRNRESGGSIGGFINITTGHACNKDDSDKDTDWDCEEWKDGNIKRGDTPEHSLRIRGKGKVPSSTMNASKNGGKDEEEDNIPERVESMSWMIESRNVCGVNWKGI